MSSSYFVGPLVSFLPPFSRVSCIEEDRQGVRKEKKQKREKRRRKAAKVGRTKTTNYTRHYTRATQGEKQRRTRGIHVQSHFTYVHIFLGSRVHSKRSAARADAVVHIQPTTNLHSCVCVAKGKEK